MRGARPPSRWSQSNPKDRDMRQIWLPEPPCGSAARRRRFRVDRFGLHQGPHYQRPSAPVPQSFKEAPPEGWKEAQPSDGVLRGKWWEIFGDPALNALEEQVSISNQNVLQAEAQFREAKAAVRSHAPPCFRPWSPVHHRSTGSADLVAPFRNRRTTPFRRASTIFPWAPPTPPMFGERSIAASPPAPIPPNRLTR